MRRIWEMASDQERGLFQLGIVVGSLLTNITYGVVTYFVTL
jgi:hypothetical protein